MRAGRSTDWRTFDQIFIQDQYGPLADLDSPELVVDCGANAGYTSVLLLNWFPGARVIAVEPDPANVEICRKNLAPYGDRAMLLAAAVWSRNARVMLSPGTLGCGKEWAREVRRPGPSEKGNIRAINVPTLGRVFLKSLDEYDCELGEWGDLTICRNLRKRTPT
jgi:FkbM family methyltransferase